MKNQIFVGNLPHQVTQEDLKPYFSPFGEITQIFVVKDRETQRSRGFGFVTFATENAASQAVEAMHGKPIDGRPLTVNLARPFVKRSSERDQPE